MRRGAHPPTDAAGPLPPRANEHGGHWHRPWAGRLGAQAAHPQRFSACEFPAELLTTLPRGLVGRLNRMRVRRHTTATHPLATGFDDLQRRALRGATGLTKPARAVPKKQPDPTRNSGAECLPTTPPELGGAGFSH